METIPPRSAGKQEVYREYPTDAARIMRRARLKRAAELLVEGIAEAGQHRPINPSVRIRFEYFSDRQNRDALVDNAAALVIRIAAVDNKVIDHEQAERFVWHHLRQHFHWEHVADLEVQGAA